MSGAPSKGDTLALFSGIADGYERRGAILSFGQDPRWRRRLVSRLDLSPGDHVLDVATGTAAVAAEMVRRHGCRVTGIDQSPDMLARARERLVAAGIADRVQLVAGEAESLPFPDGTFDALSVTYLLRYVDDPARTLRELVRVVRPGGMLASLEFGVPPGRVTRAAWRAYTRYLLPVAGGAFSPGWRHAMHFLATSIPDFYDRYPMPRLLDLYRAAGLTGLRLSRLSFGAGAIISGACGEPVRPPPPDR